MVDPAYAHPRLAELYDPLDPDRGDLAAYLAIAQEVSAHQVLDIGCGTGTFACLLAEHGFTVVGVDPAAASLAVARRKPGAERVTWIHGYATDLPPLQADLATMTGNVAQVFLADDDWAATLRAAHTALRPGGTLVFETRDPAAQAWLGWTREHTETTATVPGVGGLRDWLELVEVGDGLVTFRWTVLFDSDGAHMSSDTTLRFRSRREIEESLASAGFELREVRQAPDRPGREMVFVAQRP